MSIVDGRHSACTAQAATQSCKKGGDVPMNRIWKVLLPLVLVMALLTTAMPAFAAESPALIPIGNVKVSTAVYNKEEQPPTVKVYDADGKRISSDYYTVKVAGTPIDAGSYKVTVTAKKPYTGKKTVIYRIKKAKNPFVIETGKSSFRRNKKKDQSTWIKAVGVEEKAQLGPFVSSRSKVQISGGKLIIKRGFYGLARICIKSEATKNYKATRKWYLLRVAKL
jgi:hypothetical protein